MLVDSFARIRSYEDKIAHLSNAIDCLEENVAAFPAKVFFDGGFIMFQSGTTRPVADGEYEAHKKYMDLQVVLDGAETVVWADTATLTESTPYDETKDKVMYKGDGAVMEMKKGMFYIAYPTDAHKACRHTEKPTEYRKAVVKIEL